MPDSRELDTGAGDVCIQEKYIKNGWETFVAAYGPGDDDEKAKKARQTEEARWWK